MSGRLPVLALVLMLQFLALVPVQRAAAQEADWQARWMATIEAAKQEGELIVAASPNVLRRDYLLQQWAKDFPGIRLSLTTVRGANYLPQVVLERQAGKFLWDVYQSGPTTAIEAAKRELFDPLLSELILPEVTDPAVFGGWKDAFYDEEKKYVIGLVNDVNAPYYNAALVSPERVKAKGLELLLEPEFKGRIVWYDPRLEGPGSLYLPLLVRNLGKDNVRRLIVDQNPIFVTTLHAAAESIVRGKAAIALAAQPEQDLKEFIDAGIKMDIRWFGSSPAVAYRSTSGSSLALFNRRPHPAAARLFANWYMTKAVSTGVSRATQFDSRRNDVPPLNPARAPVPGGDYVDPQRDAGLVVTREWREEAKRLRPQ